jgi:two-component system sensor histidine kinase EvgS
MKALTVLIAEDEHEIREHLATFLRKEGLDVQAARNGEEAWKLFEAAPASMVITDWHMPQSDGFELARRIRKQKGKSIPIILTTSDPNSNDLPETHPLFDVVLEKPFLLENLKKTVLYLLIAHAQPKSGV